MSEFHALPDTEPPALALGLVDCWARTDRDLGTHLLQIALAERERYALTVGQLLRMLRQADTQPPDPHTRVSCWVHELITADTSPARMASAVSLHDTQPAAVRADVLMTLVVLVEGAWTAGRLALPTVRFQWPS